MSLVLALCWADKAGPTKPVWSSTDPNVIEAAYGIIAADLGPDFSPRWAKFVEGIFAPNGLEELRRGAHKEELARLSRFSGLDVKRVLKIDSENHEIYVRTTEGDFALKYEERIDPIKPPTIPRRKHTKREAWKHFTDGLEYFEKIAARRAQPDNREIDASVLIIEPEAPENIDSVSAIEKTGK